jgi:hypothetical protein
MAISPDAMISRFRQDALVARLWNINVSILEGTLLSFVVVVVVVVAWILTILPPPPDGDRRTGWGGSDNHGREGRYGESDHAFAPGQLEQVEVRGATTTT